MSLNPFNEIDAYGLRLLATLLLSIVMVANWVEDEDLLDEEKERSEDER
jgi:hypothetical protein